MLCKRVLYLQQEKKAKHYNNVVWTGTYVTGTYLQQEKKAKDYYNVVWMGTYVTGTYL